MRLTHIGGPTVLIEAHGWRLLVDPTFDPPGRTYKFGWGTSSTKVRGPALSPADVLPVDAVLLSHDHHADNLDDAGRRLLDEVATTVTTSSGATRLGGRTRGLSAWGETTLEASGLPALHITATPARHGPRFSRPIAGEVIGFLISWPEVDPEQTYITGDTVLHAGVRDVAARHRVDVLLMHLGGVGFGFTGPIRYTMTGRDGAELVRLVDPRAAIPVHYEGWSHFLEPPEEMARALGALSPGLRDRVVSLEPGIAQDI